MIIHLGKCYWYNPIPECWKLGILYSTNVERVENEELKSRHSTNITVTVNQGRKEYCGTEYAKAERDRCASAFRIVGDPQLLLEIVFSVLEQPPIVLQRPASSGAGRITRPFRA